MPTLIDPIKKMVQAHFDGDDRGFHQAAQEYAREERRRRRPVVADSVEQLLQEASKQSRKSETLAAFRPDTNEIPMDRDRNTPLIDIRVASRGLESLVLSDSTSDALARILNENRDSEVIRAHGIEPSRKILFCGSPGTGKTAAAEAIAQALYLPLAVVRFDSVVASYLGETAVNLRKVFDYAKTHAMVLLLDEFDSVGRDRSDASEHGELKRVVTSLLQMMDSFRGETILIAATNHQTLLDSALWRRFDELVFFEMPDVSAIELLLSRYFRQIKLEKGILLRDFANMLADLKVSQADVERIAFSALKLTILNSRKNVSSAVLHDIFLRELQRSHHLSLWKNA